MADKNLNFNIKINNKELDLTKTSFKQFDTIIKEAKKELQNLPLSDPRYKVLQTDIKNADAAWKEMNKTIAQSGDEMDDAGGKVETYKKQIKEATDELFRLEQQFGKNSKEYTDQQQKIAGLRDAQEELVRTTQDLDDTLAAIPGPLGQIGSAMQQVEGISQNVGSAMNKLGINFKTFDGVLKATGIGALVLIIAVLVAAVMNAAKSFKPLQDAFAAVGDAVGALFDALKPVTDFILKVFVGVINIAAKAISGLASVFGGVNSGFKQQSVILEREIKKQENILNNYGTFLSEYYSKQLSLLKKYNEDRKAINDDETKTVEEKNKELYALDKKFQSEKSIFEKQREKITRDNEIKVNNIKTNARITDNDNERQNQVSSLEEQKRFQINQTNSEIKAANGRIIRTQVLLSMLKLKDATYFKETIEALENSARDEHNLVKDLNKEKEAQEGLVNSQLKKIKRQATREDISLIKERSLAVMQLGTQLLKDEEARTLQQATFAINTLKEQHRKEIEDATLAGVTLKGLKEKQAAEMAAALEAERKATIQYNSFIIQLEIDKQNSLLNYTTQGTQAYFDARNEIADKELEQEILLADENQQKIEAARSKHYKTMLDLSKEGLQAQIDIMQIEYDTLYEGTATFFQKQRDIEEQNYNLAFLNAQGNHDKQEALRKQHEKNMEMIDNSELQSKINVEQMKADATMQIFGGFYSKQREVLEMENALKIKQAGDNVAMIEAIEKQHQKNMRDSRLAELQTMLEFGTQLASIASSIASAVTAVNDARMAKELKNAKGNEEEQEKIKKKYFEKNKKIQIAQAYIATFQSAVQAYGAMAGIPVVGPVLGAIAAAAAIVAGLANVSKIKSTEYESSGGGGGAAQANYGKNYGDGGMIDGPPHSQGGVPITAEGGEAVMTRGAVTMFKPILSMMNQIGGGTSFMPNAATTSFDAPRVTTPTEKTTIIKSYVVSSELTSEQQRQARLKDLSTL